MREIRFKLTIPASELSSTNPCTLGTTDIVKIVTHALGTQIPSLPSKVMSFYS